MLRLKIIASVIPLFVVGVFARDRLLHDTHPCIALGDTTVQLASGPWQDPFRVSFTEDRNFASVRVQLVDGPEMADFTVADDAETANDDSCRASATTRYVAISERDPAPNLTVHLSTEPNADYRVFVSSRRLTAWEAAALIATARSGPQRIAAAF